jgi:glycosyltransferase involved in cell wall biosynthesis
MIEAMACGTPVIAFNAGSVSEVVEPGLTGFIARDENDAVAAIEHVPHLSREKIRRRFEERFTARRMAEDYLAVYRELMRGRRHRPDLALAGD